MHRSQPATVSADPDARCPGCGQRLSVLPPEATFCPACGSRLVPKQTPWGVVGAVVDAVGVRMGRRRPPMSAGDAGPRIAVVVGYANALWRLGWRYEHGRGVGRNVSEAIRCYHKSAGLGNAEAQSRLETPAVPVVPIDEPTTR